MEPHGACLLQLDLQSIVPSSHLSQHSTSGVAKERTLFSDLCGEPQPLKDERQGGSGEEPADLKPILILDVGH